MKINSEFMVNIKNNTILEVQKIILFIVFFLFLLQQHSFARFEQETQNAIGVTSLMMAVVDEDIEGVKFFINTNPDSINAKNIGGATALHLASRVGNLEIVKLLLENGANPNLVDNEGVTPLMRASIGGFDNIVKILLENRASASILSTSRNSAIYYSTYASCQGCLTNLFTGYDFVANMPENVLKSQLETSYKIANSRQDIEEQKILQDYLNKILSTKPQYSLTPTKEDEDVKEVVVDDKITYVLHVNDEGKLEKVDKVAEISIEKNEELPIVSQTLKPIKKPQVKYKFVVGESAKERPAISTTVDSNSNSTNNDLVEKVQNENNKILRYKINKISQKIEAYKKLEEKRNDSKRFHFKAGEPKLEVDLKNQNIEIEVDKPDLQSGQQKTMESPAKSTNSNEKQVFETKTNDEFLHSFKKVFYFKSTKEDPKVVANKVEIEKQVLANQEKIEVKEGEILKETAKLINSSSDPK